VTGTGPTRPLPEREERRRGRSRKGQGTGKGKKGRGGGTGGSEGVVGRGEGKWDLFKPTPWGTGNKVLTCPTDTRGQKPQ